MKKTSLLLFTAITFANTYAQKLPQVQQVSLRAPANVKIDGKDKEWNGQFQARNTATGIFYTISNDNENLYLAIYASNYDIVSKILTNGMKIAFNAKKKSTDNSIVISYPIPPTPQEWKDVGPTLASKLSANDGLLNQADQLTRLKAIAGMHKRLKISGIDSFLEPSYSIYDSNDIMVRLDRPGEDVLYYELSIPLKYLGLNKSVSPKINYNIRLNEHLLSRVLPPEAVSGTLPGGNDEGAMIYATDFWGEYTLAK